MIHDLADEFAARNLWLHLVLGLVSAARTTESMLDGLLKISPPAPVDLEPARFGDWEERWSHCFLGVVALLRSIVRYVDEAAASPQVVPAPALPSERRTTVPCVAPSRTEISDQIVRVDHLRWSRARLDRAPGDHKEWMHFVVLAPEVSLLVNFSIADRVQVRSVQRDPQPRLVLFLCEHAAEPRSKRQRVARWDGAVDDFSPGALRARSGGIDLALESNTLRFEDGSFRIAAALRGRPIEVEIELEPCTLPGMVAAMPVPDGPPLNWAVVPRLRVRGGVEIEGRHIDLEGAPAYHDHNWGRFLWGNDVAWEWGFVLPSDPSSPWCMTFVRLTDRGRTAALTQNVLLWRGERLVRIFGEREICFRTSTQHLRPPRVFKIPPAMSLVHPDLATDVPERFEIGARATDDWLEGRWWPRDVAQVLIPSEARLGTTIFNEVVASAEVLGRVGGEDVSFVGRSVMEFIRG